MAEGAGCTGRICHPLQARQEHEDEVLARKMQEDLGGKETAPTFAAPTFASVNQLPSSSTVELERKKAQEEVCDAGEGSCFPAGLVVFLLLLGVCLGRH